MSETSYLQPKLYSFLEYKLLIAQIGNMFSTNKLCIQIPSEGHEEVCVSCPLAAFSFAAWMQRPQGLPGGWNHEEMEGV